MKFQDRGIDSRRWSESNRDVNTNRSIKREPNDARLFNERNGATFSGFRLHHQRAERETIHCRFFTAVVKKSRKRKPWILKIFRREISQLTKVFFGLFSRHKFPFIILELLKTLSTSSSTPSTTLPCEAERVGDEVVKIRNIIWIWVQQVSSQERSSVWRLPQLHKTLPFWIFMVFSVTR